jgi:hypothetical protein
MKVYLRSDTERRSSLYTSVESSRTRAGEGIVFNDDYTGRELLQIFREAAELRKASTELDERLVRVLEGRY